MTDKKIIYESVPEFDQLTQYVMQGDPVEKDDFIYYPCIVHDLPPQEEINQEEMSLNSHQSDTLKMPTTK